MLETMLLAVNASIWKTSDKGCSLMQSVSSDGVAQSAVHQQEQGITYRFSATHPWDGLVDILLLRASLVAIDQGHRGQRNAFTHVEQHL